MTSPLEYVLLAARHILKFLTDDLSSLESSVFIFLAFVLCLPYFNYLALFYNNQTQYSDD